ncbi:hypothetical protein RUND412_002064 [Rhizina undulata]
MHAIDENAVSAFYNQTLFTAGGLNFRLNPDFDIPSSGITVKTSNLNLDPNIPNAEISVKTPNLHLDPDIPSAGITVKASMALIKISRSPSRQVGLGFLGLSRLDEHVDAENCGVERSRGIIYGVYQKIFRQYAKDDTLKAA